MEELVRPPLTAAIPPIMPHYVDFTQKNDSVSSATTIACPEVHPYLLEVTALRGIDFSLPRELFINRTYKLFKDRSCFDETMASVASPATSLTIIIGDEKIIIERASSDAAIRMEDVLSRIRGFLRQEIQDDPALRKVRDERVKYLVECINASKIYKNDIARQKAIAGEEKKYRRVDKLEGKSMFIGLKPTDSGCFKLELAYR